MDKSRGSRIEPDAAVILAPQAHSISSDEYLVICATQDNLTVRWAEVKMKSGILNALVDSDKYLLCGLSEDFHCSLSK